MKKSILFAPLLLAAFWLINQQVSPTFALPPCGEDNFLDVEADPANTSYPDPYLNVYCTATEMIVESNGIINYEFIPITPGDLRARDLSWSIPLTPVGVQESIPLLGDVGVIVNGLPIYGPNEGGNQGFGDPYIDGILDFCGGHIGPTGYHNHVMAECIFNNYEGSVDLVVGYSLDGWPILAPFECADASCNNYVELQSSWQLTNPGATAAWDMHSYVAGSGDLDECNGKVQPDGSYAYYATRTFPYFLGCYVNASRSVPTAAEVVYLPIVGNQFTGSSTPLIVSGMGGMSLISVVGLFRWRKELDSIN